MKDTKQVIVIRKDLGMRRGKMVSQGAHASMKVILDKVMIDTTTSSIKCFFKDIDPIKDWVKGIFTKITCGVDSLEELEELYEKAVAAKLPCAKITDAGLTEFNGVPTVTAIAIGPAYVDDIDPITKDLKLL